MRCPLWKSLLDDLGRNEVHPVGDVHVLLSDRESEVLRELPSMLTVGQIAEAEGVSVNTVKTHIRSIYQKLGVSSRSEAVREGRSRGLI